MNDPKRSPGSTPAEPQDDDRSAAPESGQPRDGRTPAPDDDEAYDPMRPAPGASGEDF